jgi:hypothetical protein
VPTSYRSAPDMNTPSHRPRRSPPLCGAPLFDAGPIGHEPGSDERIVPLPGTGGRALRAPAQGFQAPCEMLGLVVHTALHQHQRPTPAQRPPIRVKAGLPCPVLKPSQYLGPWSSRQPRRPTREAAIAQPPHVALMLSQALSPPAARHPTAAQRPRETGLRDLASLQAPPRFEATCFTRCTSEVVRSPYHSRLV